MNTTFCVLKIIVIIIINRIMIVDYYSCLLYTSAKDIITKEQNKNQLEHDFGHLPNQGEFIEAIMNEGCPAYVEKKDSYT